MGLVEHDQLSAPPRGLKHKHSAQQRQGLVWSDAAENSLLRSGILQQQSQPPACLLSDGRLMFRGHCEPARSAWAHVWNGLQAEQSPALSQMGLVEVGQGFLDSLSAFKRSQKYMFMWNPQFLFIYKLIYKVQITMWVLIRLMGQLFNPSEQI